MNGVISKVSVEPNSIVKAGDMLLQYDDTELSGQLLIANEQVLLAQAELLNTRQAAFSDQQEKAKIALLQNRIAIKESERDFIANQTSRINVIAPNDGVVIFNDQSDLVGLPVKTGQRLMQIAQPYNTRLQIDLPVADGLVFPPDTPVKLFLDKSPLTAIEARLIYSDYEPDVTPAGVLSYRLVAQFTGSDLPRLGLHGSAKLIGDEVSLFYYLFRRPMAALRQTIGF
ncbi:MAG: biotin/lipoyl-binding protein [Pontibacterium sp.]